MPYPNTPDVDALSPEQRVYADNLWDSGQRRDAFRFVDETWRQGQTAAPTSQQARENEAGQQRDAERQRGYDETEYEGEGGEEQDEFIS